MLAPAPRTVLARTAAAFDSIAGEYDLLDEKNSLHRAMREESLAVLRRSFSKGQRVLEIGCGVGMEAVDLASRGVRVTATDVSPRMLAAAKARAERAGLSSHVDFAEAAASELASILADRAPFDGMYASFGPLNCEPDLRATLEGIASLLRPGAPAVMTLVNRVCAWEVLLYGLIGRPRKAMRRLGWPAKVPLYESGTVDVYVPTMRRLLESLEPSFTEVIWRGLLVLRPPPYLDQEYSRVGLGPAFSALDDSLSRHRFFRALGDHILVEARRR